jgi:hypothetical protein
MWIQATYTFDGKHVFGLASQELTEIVKEKTGCDPRSSPGHCWLGSIVAVESNDMGQTFNPVPQDRVIVASLGGVYDISWKTRYGYFTTSNIVMKDGYFYAFMFAQGEGVQPLGNCLLRTDKLSDSTSWRAWDGQGFNVVPRPNGSVITPCEPVAPHVLSHEVRSLTFITSAKVWVATFTNRAKLAGDVDPVPGFYMSTSTNLINWTPVSRIMEAPTRPRYDSFDILTSYPSIIDPESKSRNFETIDGSNPLLFYTVHNLRNGQGTMNRDLVYVPLRIETQ